MTKRKSEAEKSNKKETPGESQRNYFSKAELDAIINDTMIDAYDEEEQKSAWLSVFEIELSFPFPVKVIGQMVQATKIDEQYGNLKFSVFTQGNG